MQTQALDHKGRCLHALTVDLGVKDAAKFMEFLKKAFGAEEIARAPGAGGRAP